MRKIIFKIGLDDANLSWTKVKPVGYDCVFFTLNNRFSGIDENNLFLANHGSFKSKINNLFFILLKISWRTRFLFFNIIGIKPATWYW